MDEARCFVQFIHPGGEHVPDEGDRRSWNRGPHRRKFVVCRGATEDEGRERDLALWCEWEPPSDVVDEIVRPVRGGPRFIYSPYWTQPRTRRGLQNTDPFVFGGFFYSICRQLRAGRRTQLRCLQPGSVLLFGSHLRGRFVLDTVFVVSHHVDHNTSDYREVLRGVVPDAYLEIALAPFYENEPADAGGCAKGTDRRLYVGATASMSFDGMFSFFPCQRYRRGTQGFARPRVRLPGVVNPACKQVGRLNRDLPCERFLALWQSVREQVVEQGCQIGVRASLPECRK